MCVNEALRVVAQKPFCPELLYSTPRQIPRGHTYPPEPSRLPDMEVAGLTLSVLREVHTIGKSIIARIARVKEAPSRFVSVCACVTRLVVTAQDVSVIGRKNSTLFPVEMLQMFLVSIASVRDALFDMDRRLKDYCADATSSAYSFFRANACAERLGVIEQDAKDAEAKVQFLLTQLTIILTGRKMTKKVSTADETLMVGDVYRPGSNYPSLANVLHDGPTFISKHDLLKSYVLAESKYLMDSSSREVLLMGMPCDGQRNALVGLAHDWEARDHFRGGIFYINMGADATDRTVIQALAGIMRATGAVARASAVEEMQSVQDGVSAAATWFRGKPCLFLINEVCPSRNKGIQKLVRGSSESRVVLSSRSRSLAARSGLVVDIGCVDLFSCGYRSRPGYVDVRPEKKN